MPTAPGMPLSLPLISIILAFLLLFLFHKSYLTRLKLLCLITTNNRLLSFLDRILWHCMDITWCQTCQWNQNCEEVTAPFYSDRLANNPEVESASHFPKRSWALSWLSQLGYISKHFLSVGQLIYSIPLVCWQSWDVPQRMRWGKMLVVCTSKFVNSIHISVMQQRGHKDDTEFSFKELWRKKMVMSDYMDSIHSMEDGHLGYMLFGIVNWDTCMPLRSYVKAPNIVGHSSSEMGEQGPWRKRVLPHCGWRGITPFFLTLSCSFSPRFWVCFAIS